MQPSSLPARPNIEYLKNQAKYLLKAYRAGHPSALERFRLTTRHYSRLPDDDLVRPSLSLGDAQHVLAAEYGFHSWLHMRNHVQRQIHERSDGGNASDERLYPRISS